MRKNLTEQPKIVALKDLRQHAQSYINNVANVESFVVVKRSRPAFRMEPIEEQWEPVVDFSGLPGGGMDIDEVITRLEKLDGQSR
jgi:hypothetical protein